MLPVTSFNCHLRCVCLPDYAPAEAGHLVGSPKTGVGSPKFDFASDFRLLTPDCIATG